MGHQINPLMGPEPATVEFSLFLEGHVAAAPPSAASNSRRPSDCHTPLPCEVRKWNDTTHERAVLTARHLARARRVGEPELGEPAAFSLILSGVFQSSRS